MIATVMAGGLGTRLHPLTCLLPKPMIPVFDRPLLLYILKALKKTGIKRVLLTLQYRPETIMNYFGDGSSLGLDISYALEQEPMGTAGSVKNAVMELGEATLVVSGDVLFSYDLSSAFAFHKKSNSMATVLLKHHPHPRAFGIASLDQTGRVTRYHEKPASDQDIFSNLINTGTYIMEPEALNLIPPHTFFDFSKDLFPLLLKRKFPFYGYVVQGEWSDLGTFGVYKETHMKAFLGRGTIPVPGQEKGPQVWMEEDVNIAAGARLRPPLFLGKGVCLEQGVVAGPGAVVGANTTLKRGSHVKNSILGKSNCVGEKTFLQDCFIAAGNTIGKHCNLEDGVVLGGGCVLFDYCRFRNVKVWPGLSVPTHTSLEHTTVES